MRVLRDFKCEKNHITERFLDSEIKTIDCPICEKTSHRMLGYGTISLDGTNPDFPGAYEKWARVREQRARKHKRE